MNRPFLAVAFRVWLVEILISGVNYFVLMGLVYEPIWGELRAHQIGMTTRIIYIFVLAWLLQRSGPDHNQRDLIHVGALWLVSVLIFEWGGSLLLQHRPVHEILVGWQVWNGYMWPYVLLAYLFANPIVGVARTRLRAAG
ncbi:MAG TPA: hypothetical protein PK593_05630 [Thermomicrobiales bacterium]|jgi:hypothetical protein|nr:hypothetical protein [Chloroflexota bacterium]HCG29292.1 hypothetical protein [Chloroflexota bacterium]HQX62922.1 hypothetical protein [Thermomicrobiales bacterium]HQZ89027.1 hypothetical protein [Thermomicrobiales bacterium]HRA31308.1 hypothetical protein [Thermomicrobiales bacterium]